MTYTESLKEPAEVRRLDSGRRSGEGPNGLVLFRKHLHMAKFSLDDESLDELLERQQERKESDVKDSWFESLTEDDLVEPAKQALAEEGTKDDHQWYREPDIRIRDRRDGEPSARVSEEPDLVRVFETSSSSIYYVAELKKTVGKKAIGQALHYYWALQHGDKLVKGEETHELPENPPIMVYVVGVRWKQMYYKKFWDWVFEHTEFENGELGFEQLDRADIEEA